MENQKDQLIERTEDQCQKQAMPQAKKRFVALLKQFLFEEKGQFILDSLLMNSPTDFYLTPANVALDFDLDLMAMIYYDQFLGENFIKCIFRYYPQLAVFVKEVFIQKYRDEKLLQYQISVHDTADLETSLQQKVSEIHQNLTLRLNLKLSHFPYAVNQVNPATLLSNSLLREHGQLIQIKLARVVNVFQSSVYIYSKTHKCQCNCMYQPEYFTETNVNPLKIFKNQVNYSTKMGKSLYYDTVDHKNDIYCTICNQKYIITEKKFAPCQKAEILALSPQNQLVNLCSNISTLWLLEPFVNQLEIGDVVNLTAYYFISPQQQIVNERCVSPLVGSFIAFDAIKVNPFNQMIGKDSALATLFYNNSAFTSLNTSKNSEQFRNNSLLTLDNIKLHNQHISQANSSFYPKINKLVDIANQRHNRNKNGQTTQFSGNFSIFEALFELESFNQIQDWGNQGQGTQRSSQNLQQMQTQLTQDEFNDVFLQKILQLDHIEQEFGKVHLLVDKIFEGHPNLQQNSYLFHINFAMLLSSVVQMKNSLVKYLDYEAKESHPSAQIGTQPFTIKREIFDLDEDVQGENPEFSVCTPIIDYQAMTGSSDVSANQSQGENLNMLLLYDDHTYIKHLTDCLKKKGVKVVDFPSIYDKTSLIPFLLVNDHSIIVVRNPKKDVMDLLKLIIRKGFIFFKQKQPIKVNITFWVMVDVAPFIEKKKIGLNKLPKKLQELVLKWYGIDFPALFDIIIDSSQYSNLDILGTRYLQYQDNYLIERFSHCLDSMDPEPTDRQIYDFKDLKCHCLGKQLVHKAQAKSTSAKPELGNKLSMGEIFIQYYYLCQRKQHRDKDQSSHYPEEVFNNNDGNWMSLADVVKVKKLADNINFMRLFYLKSNEEHISQAQQHLSSLQAQRQQGIEIIDCVLAIFFFELYRVFKSGKALYSKEQYQYKILHFFTNLKRCREVDQEDQDLRRSSGNKSLLTQADEEDLGGLIEGLRKVSNEDCCSNCRVRTKENPKFKHLYKGLIENIVNNIN